MGGVWEGGRSFLGGCVAIFAARFCKSGRPRVRESTPDPVFPLLSRRIVTDLLMC